MQVTMAYDVELSGKLVKAGEAFEMPDDEALARAESGNVTLVGAQTPQNRATKPSEAPEPVEATSDTNDGKEG